MVAVKVGPGLQIAARCIPGARSRGKAKRNGKDTHPERERVRDRGRIVWWKLIFVIWCSRQYPVDTYSTTGGVWIHFPFQDNTTDLCLQHSRERVCVCVVPVHLSDVLWDCWLFPTLFQSFTGTLLFATPCDVIGGSFCQCASEWFNNLDEANEEEAASFPSRRPFSPAPTELVVPSSFFFSSSCHKSKAISFCRKIPATNSALPFVKFWRRTIAVEVVSTVYVSRCLLKVTLANTMSRNSTRKLKNMMF